MRRQCLSNRWPSPPTNGLHRAASVLSAALLASFLGAAATPAGAAACMSLSRLRLPDTTITAAQPVAAGPYTAPDTGEVLNLPAHCRIAATLTPTSDSSIKIEVWMPYSAWNGRYLGTGNGGIGGRIVYGSLSGLAYWLALNYAVANTDMGTSLAVTDPAGALALIDHPEQQIDFATRSTHLMTVRAKQIIKAFYGERARHSYFFGCSTGGGQALHEALQFPGDYNGIFAGAPANNETHSQAGKVWNYAAFHAGPGGSSVGISATQVSAITAAILKQCAGKDGGLTSDNFLTDPRDCAWDPAVLQCTGTAVDPATCLTAPQVLAMRKFYQGPINPRTGERILAGRTLGSEAGSGQNPITIEAAPSPVALNTFAPYWVFGADFDWRTFDFDHDVDTIDDEMAARLNANTADLEEFQSHGGKLLLWHGFADPTIPTLNTIAYYERLIASQTRGRGHGTGERKEGLRRTQEFARVFLAPGVGHCGGGAGAFNADFLPALEQWVEDGVPPDRIIASKVVGGVTTFTRPLCPYPALARYTGVGDPTKADSFTCVADRDHDDNQPPAPKYLDDGDNYPIVPIRERDRDHDRDNR
jgi:feruloyl esterase